MEHLLPNLKIPRLVSYPRTGSHWLRLMLEAYVGKYCAPTRFFTATPNVIWGIHIHNRDVDNHDEVEGPCDNLEKVIYLYRDPKDTVYSQLKYDNTIPIGWNADDDNDNLIIEENMMKLINEYKNHLLKWKDNNQGVNKFLQISYEQLKEDTAAALRLILNFLDPNHICDDERIEQTVNFVSKDLTNAATEYSDQQALNNEVINNPEVYENSRDKFKEIYNEIFEKEFANLI